MPEGPVNAYPFTAVVGMDDAKRAVECALINPHIRTVLIRGGFGTAKTVLARSCSDISSRKIVNCPVNISDEQLFGGLDVEATVKTGVPTMQPGLLARADSGILYIDDINLMDRGILSGLLGCVQEGIVRVERGPISSLYRCDTVLIATMNPENSDLSDHMLDRFDLCAYVSQSDDDSKKRILRRNSDFIRDSQSFSELFYEDQQSEKNKIENSKKILPYVEISDELISLVSELCLRVGADGIRADLAMIRCACSIAALNGRDEVIKKDIEEAAVLCLPHRKSYSQPLPEPENDREEPPPEPPQNDQEPPEEEDSDKEDEDNESEDDDDFDLDSFLPDLEEMIFEIGREFRVIDYLGGNERIPARTKARKGRRAMAVSADGTGRYARSKIPVGKVSDIAFDATLRAAAPYQRTRSSDKVSIVIEKADIREKVRERRSGCTLLFVVDASGSLGARKRMATVKGAIMSMLRDSYVRRDRIGLMAFRRDSAEVILPPTKSVEYSYKMLEDLPTGGKTPLAEAIISVEDYMNSYSRCHLGERCYIILVTDGRANVPLVPGTDANEEVQKLAEKISIPNVKWIVVDAGSGFPRFDNAEKLAMKLCARYFKLEDLDADRFADGVRVAMNM